MRFIHVSLSWLASLMAVQATTLVTIVKTVAHDRVLANISVPALGHEPISGRAKISRRDEDGSLGDPLVTKVCMTTPVTTCVDITITSTPADSPKSTDTKPTPQTITHTIEPQTITHAQEPPNPSLRNTGITTTHASPQLTFTDIPAEWPPSIGPHGDPDIDVTQLPNIVHLGYTPPAKPTRIPKWCDAYPYPACKKGQTPDTDRCCEN